MEYINKEHFLKYLSEYDLNLDESNMYLRMLDTKVWINPSLQEHDSVEKHTAAFVNDFVRNISTHHPTLSFKVVPSGSYYSRHRVGRPYEFDFMLVLQVSKFKVQRVCGSLYYDIIVFDLDEWKWLFEESMDPSNMENIFREKDDGTFFLDTQNLMDVFQYIFSECLEDMQLKWGIHAYGFSGNSPAINVSLYWDKKAISLDLVPCFSFPKSLIQEVPELQPKFTAFLDNMLQEYNYKMPEHNGTHADYSMVDRKICTYDRAAFVHRNTMSDAEICTYDPNAYVEEELWLSVTGKTFGEEYVLRRNKLTQHDSTAESDELKTVYQEITCDRLYLVFSKDMARLSTSLVEKLIFEHIGCDLLRVLRIAKYLVQTFHITIDKGTSSFSHLSSSQQSFGLQSGMQSRYVSMLFLHIILKSQYQWIRQSDHEMLTAILCSFLGALKYVHWRQMMEVSFTCFFSDIKVEPQKSVNTAPHFSHFQKRNVDTINTFLLTAIKRKDLDIMELECKPNHVKCQMCWGPFMDNLLEIMSSYFPQKPFSKYPEKLCLMHDYMSKTD